MVNFTILTTHLEYSKWEDHTAGLLWEIESVGSNMKSSLSILRFDCHSSVIQII